MASNPTRAGRAAASAAEGPGSILTPQESDHLDRLARVVAQTMEVLGTIDKARAWLKTPNRALGNEVPLSLMDTDTGSRQVEEVLLRLNYGIFS